MDGFEAGNKKVGKGAQVVQRQERTKEDWRGRTTNEREQREKAAGATRRAGDGAFVPLAC